MATDTSPKAVIFDLDGVLIDSAEAHYRAWKAICAERGKDLALAEYHATIGTGTALTARMLFGDALPEAEVAKISVDKEEAFRREARERLVLIDGGSGLIRALSEAGWRVALGTSAPRKNVECVLDRIPAAGLLTVKVWEEMVPGTKPEPDVFLKAAELSGVPPELAVVIEDSLAGLEAARRAGMAAVGLTTTISRDRLRPNARLVVDSLRELTPDILSGLIR